jgi:hypothetical protein
VFFLIFFLLITVAPLNNLLPTILRCVFRPQFLQLCLIFHLVLLLAMLASLALTLTTLLASSSLFVRADVDPLAPAPGDVFTEGSTCHIAWTVDTSGLWKTTNIELMTGNNFDMVHLTSAYTCTSNSFRGGALTLFSLQAVTTVDGTTVNVFDYPCPAVSYQKISYLGYRDIDPSSHFARSQSIPRSTSTNSPAQIPRTYSGRAASPSLAPTAQPRLLPTAPSQTARPSPGGQARS